MSPVRMRPPLPLWADWPWPDWLYRLRRRVAARHDRRRQMRALLALDDRLLADIGISREQALREARKWFWQ